MDEIEQLNLLIYETGVGLNNGILSSDNCVSQSEMTKVFIIVWSLMYDDPGLNKLNSFLEQLKFEDVHPFVFGGIARITSTKSKKLPYWLDFVRNGIDFYSMHKSDLTKDLLS